jgi:hypothetical protein
MPTVHYSHMEDRYWVRDGDDIAWFDGPLEAQQGALAIDRKHAILAEIKLIAEYFRRMGMNQVAASIEAGDYKK